jgi:hypothetical protein
MVAGMLLAACAPMAAGLAAARGAGRPGSGTGRSGSRAGQGAGRSGSRTGQGAIAGLCTGATAALVIAVLSTATIALLPHDAGLRDWAVGHVGQWTPGTPILGVRLGYVAGASAFAAGYLLVLVLGPLLGCGLGAWAASATGARPPWRRRVRTWAQPG